MRFIVQKETIIDPQFNVWYTQKVIFVIRLIETRMDTVDYKSLSQDKISFNISL